MPRRSLLRSAICALAAATTAHAVATCYGGDFGKADFPFCQQLSPKYALHWNVASDNSSLTLGILAETSGWAAVGFSESGGMFGANIYAVEKNSSDSYALKNYFSTRPGIVPPSTAIPSAILVRSTFTNGVLSAVVKKVLDEDCDYNDARIKAGYVTPVIWAIGNSDAISYHDVDNRGDTQIAFIQSSTSVAQDNDAKTLDLRMYNVTIPSTVTNYLCSFYALPNDTKYHVTRAEPLIMSKKYVHHIIVYGCTDALNTSLIGTTIDCASMTTACSKVMITWSPGGSTVDYPAEAGFPIGVGPNAVKYVSVQTHYNNVNGDAGNIDNSGMRITYTSNLRPNDLGVIVFGSIGINIPPGNSSYSLDWNTCPSGCTSQFSQALTIVTMRYHMHELGRKFQTRIIRNGTEVHNPHKEYFDFGYQVGMRAHPKNLKIQPGDTLLSRCTYDSTSRTNVTRLGESTLDEMCFNFVLYYPFNPRVTYCVGLTGNYSTCATEAAVGGILGALRTNNATAIGKHVQSGSLVLSEQAVFTPLPPPVCVNKLNTLVVDPPSSAPSPSTSPSGGNVADGKGTSNAISIRWSGFMVVQTMAMAAILSLY